MSRRTFYTSVTVMLAIFVLAAWALVVSSDQSTVGMAANAAESPSTTEPLATSSTVVPSTSTTVAATTTSVVRTTTTAAPATTTTVATTIPSTTTTTAQVAARPVQPTCSRIDIDISEQRLTARCTDGTWTIPISSGSEVPYCENGSCGDAVTPRGSFRVHRMDPGLEEAPLGTIYNGIYFYRGYAIHGGALPGYPASHGCVRVRYSDADWLFAAVYIGTEVHIRD